MKTLIILSIISLVLIVIGIDMAFANSIGNKNAKVLSLKVKYQVDVHYSAPPAADLADDNSGYIICGGIVVITDEKGRPVAPAQALLPGVTSYYFSEAGPVSGSRIARLIKDPHLFCPRPAPSNIIEDMIMGQFSPGPVYRFKVKVLAPKQTPKD